MTAPAPQCQPSTAQPDEQRHETIFLQPWCNGCDKHSWGSDGRQWCEDDAWSQCEECEQKSVKYVRAESHATLTARVVELEKALRGAHRVLQILVGPGDDHLSSMHVYAQAVAAECESRAVLKPKGAAV